MTNYRKVPCIECGTMLYHERDCFYYQAAPETGDKNTPAYAALLAERDGLAKERDDEKHLRLQIGDNAEQLRESNYALEKRVGALRAENERMRAALETVAVFVNTDKYAARENVLSYIRAALNP